MLAATVGVLAAAVVVGGIAGAAINHPAPGIFGRVTVQPSCPVIGPTVPCRGEHGVAATVEAVTHGQTAATARSNSAGDYAMGLQPGQYTIIVDARSTHCPQRTVTVSRSQSVQVNIHCRSSR